MTEHEISKLAASLDRDLAASKMTKEQKQAIKDRQILRAKELSEVRAIRGLDPQTGRHKPKVTLPSGLQINADAFDI